MERGGSSKRDAIRVPNSGREENAGQVNEGEEIVRRKTTQYVPVAGVTRIMRTILPSHVRIADDAKETVQECVSEFISFITTEANQKCHAECRRTINADDIISAMDSLGFHNYLHPLTIYLNNFRAQDHNHK